MRKNGKDRRDFLKFMAIAGSGVLMGGGVPLSGFASDKTKFVMAATGGSWGNTIKDIFIEKSGFQNKFNLDVSYEQNIDSVVVAKALANKKHPMFDVSSAATFMAAKMNAGGILEPELDLDIVTNWKDIYPQAKIDKYFAGYITSNMVLVYNTDYVKKPTSFKDLWNSKYKGHVGFSNYKHVGSSFLHCINKLYGGKEDNVMPGIEAFAELMKKQKAIPFDNTDHGMKLFQRKELWIAPFWDGRARQLQESGLPIDYAFVDYWMPLTMGFPVLKNSKVRKIAMEFVNYTLDPDLQAQFTMAMKFPPTNRKCKLPAKYEHWKVTDKQFELAADLDYNKLVLESDKNLELWNKHVLGS